MFQKRILETVLGAIVKKAFATSLMTTAVEDGGRLQRMPEALRIAYSRGIEYAARPNMIFQQFVTQKTELGVQRGNTISMLAVDDIKLGGALVEGTPIVTQALSGSERQITVQEYGNAVSYSELLYQTSFLNFMALTVRALSDDYALVTNIELRDVMLTGTNVTYAWKHDATTGKPTAKGASRADLDATSTFDVALVKDALEILSTNFAPTYPGEEYICILHPHQSRGLRDDPSWRNMSNYGAPSYPFTAEIGRIDNTRFVETQMMCNGAAPATQVGGAFKDYLKAGFNGDADNPAVTVNVFQAVMFGPRFTAQAIALPVELRDDGVVDFGREHRMAWYGIWGSAMFNDSHGVRLETA